MITLEYPTPWTKDFLNRPWGQLCYHRTGGDKPSMVLLHGAMDNGLCWSRIAKEFEPEFDVVMPDARGHGLSVPEAYDFHIADMVEDVAVLIQDLGLHKPVVMGHSMGAQMATVLAAQYPQLVGKIVLEDPAYDIAVSNKLTLWAMKTLGKWMIKRNRKKDIAAIQKMSDRLNKAWHIEEREPWAYAQKQFAKNIGVNLFQIFEEHVDWEGYFPKIETPALLIISEKGLIKDTTAQAYISVIPNAELVRIPDAGHNIRRENFGAFMAAVREFLRG